MRVGYLGAGERLNPLTQAFKDALRDHGWVEGQNLVIEYRFGGGHYDRLRALAADLVRTKVDVIFAGSAPAAQAAKEATTTIPIVFHTLNDPVRAGLVTSIARPGGNMSRAMTSERSGKRSPASCYRSIARWSRPCRPCSLFSGDSVMNTSF